LIIFLISLSAIGLTIFLYLKTLSLIPLRIISIIILYILITGFILSFTISKQRNPPALLIDHSASMKSYMDDMNKSLSEVQFAHTEFYFGETLYVDPLNDSLFSSRFTDIGKALKDICKKEPSSIVLVSDGNHNYGHFPFSEIKDLGIPIYTIGVGREKIRDVAISDVIYSSYAYFGDSVKIEVIIESQGFVGNRAQVTLRYNKKSAIKSLLLSDTKSKSSLEFWVKIDQPEQIEVLIDVAHQAEESTYENNHIGFSLKVFQKKTKIIYYTDHLSFNSKFLVRNLSQDAYIDLLPLAKINKTSIMNLTENRQIRALPELDDIDVLILDNVDLKNLPWSNIEETLKRGMGLLCIGSLQGQTTKWNEMLPINTAGAVVKGNFPITIKESFSTLVPGDDYPPLSTINRVLGINDKAIIIAHSNNIPIIAYQNYGTGIVFQINAVAIGTWHFLELGLKQKNIFALLISDIIRFLSPIGKNKRLFLSTLHSVYDIGEVIFLKLQSYDKNYRLASGGDFLFEYDNTKIPFFEIGRGIYEASFIPKQAGDISLKASGKLENEELISNTLKLTVAGSVIETDKGLNKHFLETLSSETGGKYFNLNDITDFELPPIKTARHRVNFNFDSPISYILILVLLVIDWIIRRRKGII
jgi:hypothetical protein